LSNRPSLLRYAWLSIAGALATISLKALAYWLTGSVGLLSDALESVVNLAAASLALAVLIVVAKPPDAKHPYGHEKAEYFSSGLEGGLIVLAALTIGAAAVNRLLNPQPLDQVPLGLAVSVAASAINLAIARILLKAAREHHSIALEADAQHLMTDVWTSVGVVAGVAAVGATGWHRLDPLIALVVAANIVRTGILLMRHSVHGLMDVALPLTEQAVVKSVLERYRDEGAGYHALRTRAAGSRRFVSVHILVPDEWSVRRGHDLLERIEAEIRHKLENATVFTHLEPLHDPRSYDDIDLDRAARDPEMESKRAS
jgi:cation diffusion facilitator family transporter